MTPVDLEIRIESYGFECEAGPLVNCLDWIELKGWIFGMQEALEKLSRLGNGDLPGNSIGNEIAQAALKQK